MVTLCIDAGTTVIKAVAYEDGREAAVARRPTSISSPRPGFAEQDMHEVWDAAVATLREAAAYGDVDLIALTAQGDGCWLVDDHGRPTGPAILWNDGRAASIADRWRDEGLVDKAFRINGSVAFPGLAHAILTWLAEHDPDRLSGGGAALTCGGWLYQRLTGEIAIDHSDAAAPWLDVAALEYSPEILDMFDLSWAAGLLPRLRADGERVAALSAEAADQLGLRAGLPVVMAPYDIAATAIGAGAVDERQACVILGTTLSTQVVAGSADRSGPPTGLTIPLAVGGRYLRALPTSAGTQILDWAAGLLGLSDAAEVCAMAASAAPGADGLAVLPYLSPGGERVPFTDVSARGAFMGLSLDHDRLQVARAVLEGLTYVIRDCLDVSGVEASQLRVCGGGANSAEWCRLIADVTDVPVVRSADREVGAKGAFCFALVATGRAADHATAVATYTTIRDEFLPDPDRHAIYDDLFGDFRALREDAARSWPRLARARTRAGR